MRTELAAMLVRNNRNSMHIAVWLIVVCAMIYLVIAVGGYTRLTDSGLSIVEWDPISGVIPPLSRAAWEAEFKRYQQFPEFKLINQDMQLNEFKQIYWVEYAHRLVARTVGLVFLVPFVFFLVRGYLSKAMTARLAVLFLLGGLQGALGWYMVASGLVNNPAVSQYRLTAHLALAIGIYSYVLWLAVGLIQVKQQLKWHNDASYLRNATLVCLFFVVLMQISGAMMAGTHAGFVINTFPDMNGQMIPQVLGAMQPLWRNLFENVVTIQFTHRWIAVATVLAVIALWLGRFSTSQSGLKRLADLILVLALVQFCLGIATLLSHVQLPIALAHQSGFVLVTSALVVMLRLTWTPAPMQQQAAA